MPHSEAEIRALVRQAHMHGELTRSEHRLIHAIFEFDDMICRRVMVPRRDAVFLDVEQSFPECLEIINRTKHSRYPLCEGSLEHVVGIVHVKDLVGVDPNSPVDLRKYARPPHHVPETMPMSQLLRHFQRTHQLMALVVDEYGTIVGVVTLENVMEQIVGSVEDEFDTEPPPITADGERQFIVLGSTPVELVNEQLGLQLEAEDVDTIAGALVEQVGRLLQKGDCIELQGARAEVIEVEGARAKRIRITLEAEAGGRNEAGGRTQETGGWRLEAGVWTTRTTTSKSAPNGERTTGSNRPCDRPQTRSHPAAYRARVFGPRTLTTAHHPPPTTNHQPKTYQPIHPHSPCPLTGLASIIPRLTAPSLSYGDGHGAVARHGCWEFQQAVESHVVRSKWSLSVPSGQAGRRATAQQSAAECTVRQGTAEAVRDTLFCQPQDGRGAALPVHGQLRRSAGSHARRVASCRGKVAGSSSRSSSRWRWTCARSRSWPRRLIPRRRRWPCSPTERSCSSGAWWTRSCGTRTTWRSIPSPRRAARDVPDHDRGRGKSVRLQGLHAAGQPGTEQPDPGILRRDVVRTGARCA